jgi:hypothetical protein
MQSLITYYNELFYQYKTLKILTFQYEPFVYDESNLETGEQTLRGIEINLIEILAEQLDFRSVKMKNKI